MRFESVRAHAFGPFRNATLTLAPGMNVVYGPNEAGKSSWHAALYAGLCGMRRGQGQPRKEDREFAARHRPWDSEGWEVGAIVTLSDDRRVELRHDLAGRVNSSARDADLANRDYSNEIMSDGAPDGATWLGLDRRTFVSTACVRQADILGLMDDAESLQHDLQRAAATAGSDATAAQALQLLRDYHSQHVGTDRAWTKPLQTARDAVSNAQQSLQAARTAHAGYLERRAGVDSSEERVRLLETRLHALRAVMADREATASERRLEQARLISADFTSGPPRLPSEEDDVTQRVAAVLQAWSTRTRPEAPSGPSVAELEAEIAALAAAPTPPSTPVPGSGIQRVLLVAGGGTIALVGLLVMFGAMVTAVLAALVGAGLLLAWAGRRGRNLPRPAPDSDAASERRIHLRHLIDDRREDDRQYVETRRQLQETADSVLRVAQTIGTTTDDPEAGVRALEDWQRQHRERVVEADRARARWDELQQLLGSQTLAELDEQSQRLRFAANAATAGLEPDVLQAARLDPHDEDAREHLERECTVARDAWNTARGQITQIERDLPSVADAEDQLAATEREQTRIESLDRVLGTTIRLLEAAEQRVHRDIAPILKSTVLTWLPTVTRGRYVDCRIDPETLEVEVAGESGKWRRAELLSRGTTEQLYLLLRFALAQHLVRAGESCPLILDDVVAACDKERKREVLEALLVLSKSVQVILFTHEEDVLAWATDRLHSVGDRVTQLDGSGVPA